MPAGPENGLLFRDDASPAGGMRPQLEFNIGPPPSDEALMRTFQDGGEAAFTVLVERYAAKALNYAWRLTGEFALAQDVAQEAFFNVYARRRAFGAGERFLTWFYRIVGNLCRMEWRRRRAPRPAAGKSPADDAPPEPELEERASRREIEQRAQDAVLALPEKLRLVFVLSLYEGLSYGEIAGVLGCSVATVAARKRAAVQRLGGSLGTVGRRFEGEPN